MRRIQLRRNPKSDKITPMSEKKYKDYPFPTRLKGHFSTITRHKLLVGKLCFRLGLYRQGLLHDLSKYSPTEFLPGVKYFQGDRSPIEREKVEKGYSKGWLHHKGHNPHHWEYWMDRNHRGEIFFNEIPKNYVKEMVCDRVAACMIYQGERYNDASALNYLHDGGDQKYMHPNSAALLEKYLTWIKDYGLDQAFEMIKKD